MEPRPYAPGLQGKGLSPVTAQEFRDARAELGWTQSATASALGVTLRAVQYYEAGQRAIPGPVDRIMAHTLDLTRRLNAEPQA